VGFEDRVRVSQRPLFLGQKITVNTIRGREDTIISHLPDGRVVLFDQKSQYFNLLAPSQSVEGHIIHIQKNFIIVNPISEPIEIEFIRPPEVEAEDIIADLEELIKKVSGNAEVIPKALLHIIRLQKLMIKILKGEAVG